MGIQNHDVVVATTWDAKRFAKAKSFLSSRDDASFFLFGPVRVNGYRTIICDLDGSKEGWKDSDDGDNRRREFIAVLELIGGFDYAEVSFGEFGAEIKETNCKDRYS